ncbi:MAG TPA: metallophosphoesterase family protein [Spirochaetales bacterium]|nr:metallophosphoesterase family protein [Spirochaetales bacterium]
MPRTVPIALAGAAATTAVLAWLFSLPGVTGLFRWGYQRPVFIALALLAAAPPAFLLVAAATRRLVSDKAARFPRAVAALVGALGLLVSLAACVGVSVAPVPGRPAESPLELVDERVGIAPAADLARLSFASDAHFGAETANAAAREAVISGVAASIPARDAFFVLGDHVEMGMLAGPWREEAETFARLAPSLPLVGLMGNHDSLVNGAPRWRAYWKPDGADAVSGSPYYRSFEAGPATIVILNLLWGAESFDRKQRAWLERTLAAIPPERPVIVLSHAFAWASGYIDPASRRPWYDEAELIARVCPILEKHRVELMISGHNHYLELLESNGVSYALVGALGGKPDPEPTHRSPASKWIAVGEFGWLDVDASAAGLALTFRDRNGTALRELFVETRP